MRMTETPLTGSKFLLVGPPKAGKSTMAATFPAPFVINTDGALNGRLIYKAANPDAAVVNVYDFSGYKNALKRARKERKSWRTLILDVLDEVQLWSEDDVLASLSRKNRRSYDSISEVEHGAGWEGQFAMFRRVIDELWRTAAENTHLEAVIIVAHSAIRDGLETLALREKLAQYIAGRVDHVAHVVKAKKGKTGLVYSVDFGGGAFRRAGSRFAELQSAGIITPPTYDALIRLLETGDYTVGTDQDTVVGAPAYSIENFRKAVAWAERNGIRKEALQRFAKEKGLSKEDIYSLLVTARRTGELGELEVVS